MRVDEEFVQQYERLVRQIARHWARRVGSTPDEVTELTEEFTATGYLGLLRAAETFDPQRGWQFTTYAGHHIEGAIRHALRDDGLIYIPERERGKGASLTVLSLEEVPEEVPDRRDVAQEALERLGVADSLRGALRRLTEREQEALWRCVLGGWTLEELAHTWGTTRQNVWRCLQKAKAKLRSAFPEEQRPQREPKVGIRRGGR